MTTEYRPAPEVAEIAADLIRDVERHKTLDSVRLEYVFRGEAAVSKGRLVLGKARRITGLNAFLARPPTRARRKDAPPLMVEAEPFFVIEIAEDTWDRLNADQRRALVDHELCHLRADEVAPGEWALSILGHDLEEFACIVDRHGFWKADVARFGAAVSEQLTLAIEESVRFVDGMRVDPDTGEIIEAPDDEDGE